MLRVTVTEDVAQAFNSHLIAIAVPRIYIVSYHYITSIANYHPAMSRDTV